MLGKNQIIALKYLENNKSWQNGYDFIKSLQPKMGRRGSYKVTNNLIARGYIASRKEGFYTDNSLANQYLITRKGQKALYNHLVRKVAV